MDILTKLFDSQARVKIMRLFVLNPATPFGRQDIQMRSQVSPHAVSKEAALLLRAQLISRKTFTRTVQRKRGGKTVSVKARIKGWELNLNFPYFYTLRQLLIESTEFTPEVIVRRFRNAGKIRLLLIAGIFLNDDLSRVDILIVGDGLRKNSITATLKSIESEVGRELRYAVFETDEFLYRLSIYDKFVRDMLDFRHVKVIDKLGVKLSS